LVTPDLGVNGPSLKRGDGVFHELGFVERVCMDCYLYIVFIRDGQRTVNGRWPVSFLGAAIRL